MKKLISVILAALMLISLSTAVLAVGNREESPKSKLQVPQELKEKGDTLNKLNDEGKKLKEQLRDGKCPDGKKEDCKKDKSDSEKNRKPHRKELTDAQKKQLEPYFKQVKTIRDGMKTRRETMKGYRSDLEKALDSKDNKKAGQIMDKMIELKKAQNSELKKLVEIKAKIRDIVKAEEN